MYIRDTNFSHSNTKCGDRSAIFDALLSILDAVVVPEVNDYPPNNELPYRPRSALNDNADEAHHTGRPDAVSVPNRLDEHRNGEDAGKLPDEGSGAHERSSRGGQGRCASG